MRTLEFIVNGQLLEPDPACDFSGLVPGTDGYLQAHFTLSKEWEDCGVVVSFHSTFGKEYGAYVLGPYNTCDIPKEALKKRAFKMQVLGIRRDDYRLSTNKLEIKQTGGTV